MDCSSCGAQPISSVYCQHCKDVNLDFSAQDHFSVFHLPLQYSLAKDVLEERYLKLSRVTHPDLVCGEIKKDPRLLALSSFVNESYRVLKDDFLRAEAMLKYYSEGLSLDGNALPPCFLMDMLELQEEVESYVSDPEKFEDELEKVESKMEEKISSTFERIRFLFDSLSGKEEDSGEIPQEIQRSLNTIRYYRRALESVEKALEEL